MAEIHFFAEWSPEYLGEIAPIEGRSLLEAFEEVVTAVGRAGARVRLHVTWPLLGAGEPFPLTSYARLARRLATLGARLSLWPVVERRRGYFLNARTAELFRERLSGLEQRLDAVGLCGHVGLMMDLEPPLPWVFGRRCEAGPPSPRVLAELTSSLLELRLRGVLDRLQAAVVPGLSGGTLFDDVIVMAYGSIPDLTRRLEFTYPWVTRVLARMGSFRVRRDGVRSWTAAVGVLNRGVLQKEPTFVTPEAFSRALASTGDADEVGVYALCGLLTGPAGLVTPDPDLTDRWAPIAPRKVRSKEDLARWVTPLVERARLASQRASVRSANSVLIHAPGATILQPPLTETAGSEFASAASESSLGEAIPVSHPVA